MIPKIQTRPYRGSLPHERGNCYPAVIASILEMEVEDVFQVQEYYDEYWKGPLDDWLQERGWKIKGADDFKAFHQDLWLRQFIDTEGRNPDGLPGEQWREIMRDELSDKYYFVAGTSPRNPDINHIVIYQNGKMVHDPHPDQTGILSEEWFSQLIKIGEL